MRRSRRLRVFVVEDSDIVRTRLVALLVETRGVEVAGEAASMADAVTRLPVVVVLTRYAYPHLEARGRAEGADWFLDKATAFLRVPDILTSLRRRAPVRVR